MFVIEILRVAVALCFMLLLPGYFWSKVLFFGEDMNALERIVHSIFLSIALISASFFFANLWFKIPINLFSSTVIITILTAIPLIILRLRGKIGRRPGSDADGGMEEKPT